MTEQEWLACTDPKKKVAYLSVTKCDRKLRLFGCAFSRSIWSLVTDDCFRKAVDVAERFADGIATTKELSLSKKESGAALERSGLDGPTGTMLNAKGCMWSTTRFAGSAAMYPLWVFTDSANRNVQESLLTDIFGNPFRTIAVDQSCLSQAVTALARSIYDERAFERLQILADALEEAGCLDPEILGHCRQSGPHVRGCWVVDLLVGKN